MASIDATRLMSTATIKVTIKNLKPAIMRAKLAMPFLWVAIKIGGFRGVELVRGDLGRFRGRCRVASIDDALLEIVREIKNVRDIRRVPDTPPESNDQFPFVVVYPASGVFQKESAGWSIALHNINIELHVARKDLPRDFTKIVTLYDRLPNQLESGLENSRFTAITTWGNISYEFGTLQWAGVETLGVVYTMNQVKLLDTVS